jgi:uncharacterized membrane protein
MAERGRDDVDALVRSLAQRLNTLEAEVARLRDAVPSVPPPAPSPVPPRPTEPTGEGWLPQASVAPPAVPPPPPDPEREARLVGAWFARIGAAAVLVGAAFAFKYAVDRGLIGPGGRVALGVLAGLAFVVWGERARARDWPRLAQAVTGGGVGLLYLSVWAAFGLYRMIPPEAAFVLLAAVTAAGALLALRHDSEVLAVLALAGGFLDPYLTGLSRVPGPLFGAVLLLDAGAVVLAWSRGWRVVEAKAMAGTWLVALGATATVSPGLVEAFAVAAFVLFAGAVLARALDGERAAGPAEAVALAGNALAFFGVSLLAIAAIRKGLQGEFTLLLGAVHLGAGLLVRRTVEERRIVWGTLLGLGVGLATVAVPMELEGPPVAIAWAAEAVLLLLIGNRGAMGGARLAGVMVLALSLIDSVVLQFGIGLLYDPDRLLLSVQSLTLVLQVVALYGSAWLLSRSGVGWERSLVPVGWIGANVLTLSWFSLEARAAFDAPSIFGDPEGARALHFTYTAIWALYAGALLAVGVGARSRGVRLLAVAIFGATILKMVVFDLWLLEPLHRTVAFTGLGLLLLSGSLMYHRFRDLVLEDR